MSAATAARCWLCGHPCPIPLAASAEPRCVDLVQCFARSVAPPGAPERHPAGTGACPEEEPCGACAAAYSEAYGDGEAAESGEER